MTNINVIDNQDLICPITLQVFRDPVRAKDGHVYERQAIIKWIVQHGTSPLTRQPLALDDLQTDEHIKDLTKQRRISTVSFDVGNERVTLPSSIRRNRWTSRIYPSSQINSPIFFSTNEHRNKMFVGIFCCILVAIGIIIATVFVFGKSSDEIESIYRGELRVNSSLYNRLNSSCSIRQYYFNEIEMLICKDGSYKLTSRSSFDIDAYFYLSHFNSTNSNDNLLISNDDDGGANQFYFEYFLQSNSNKYVLVVTSYEPNVTGSYSIYIRGPATVYFY